VQIGQRELNALFAGEADRRSHFAPLLPE
jgi:hypothetical protein